MLYQVSMRLHILIVALRRRLPILVGSDSRHGGSFAITSAGAIFNCGGEVEVEVVLEAVLER